MEQFTSVKKNDWIKDGKFWGKKGFMYVMNEVDG